MQTILGAGGAIGTELAKSLTSYTAQIRLVSRNPKAINSTDETFTADLLKADEVSAAVEGSRIVYLTAGLPYKASVWEEQWPIVMKNVIDACKKYQAKLVFFDNIYMYDPEHLDGMNEETPMRPTSRKGKVRKQLIDMIFREVDAGNLTALIARSADFYGPGVKDVSVLSQTIIENLAKGKSAQVMGNPAKKHSYTFTPDAGKATALLGNTEDAFNQVWHLPTASNPPTGDGWVKLFAEAFGSKPKYMAIGKAMLRTVGIFIPVMKEFVEMLYQYQTDYVFDSSKFEKRFNVKPTSYEEGIKRVVQTDYQSN